MAKEAGHPDISSGTVESQGVQDVAGHTGSDKIKNAQKVEDY